MKKILVVIPTYNEAENIGPLIRSIFKTFKNSHKYLAEVIIVDDNSPDGTAKIVKKFQKTNRNIHLIEEVRAGLGRAYTRGLKYGLALGPNYALIMMDGDFSHNPSAMLDLLAAIESGADYAIGSRYVRGGGTSDSWPLFRLLQSRLANFLAYKLVGIQNGVKDLTSGFKAIRRTALQQIPLDDIPASGYVYQVNLLYEFSTRGFSIKEVPIIFEQRRAGKSKLGLKDMVEFLFLSYRLNPNSGVRRAMRFGLVGACGTLVNLVVLTLGVTVFKLSPLVAIAFAIEISIISNFFMNHLYTFKFKLSKDPDLLVKLIKYNVIALGGAFITYAAFAIGYRYLGLHYILADLLAIMLALTWNYLMSVRVVWRTLDRTTSGDDGKLGVYSKIRAVQSKKTAN